jgi:signal transduction histidine kinase
LKISLRWQIVLWLALAMPVVIFVLAFSVRHVMVGSLYGSIDDSLRYRAQVVAAAISKVDSSQESYADVVKPIAEQFNSVSLLLRVADSQDNIITRFGHIPDKVVPSMDRQLYLANTGGGGFDSIKIKGTEALRVYTLPVRDPSTQKTAAFVQTAESLEQVDKAQERLWYYTIAIGTAGSILAILVVVLIVGHGLRPLQRILKRVREIETHNLQLGLPEEPRPPELQQLADSLNSMLRRLNETFKAKQIFVASVSHDLRTPLTVLQGQIEVLLMQPSLNAESRESLERMSKETRRLIRMTNNLVLNEQLGSNPSLVTGPVSLRELMEEVVADVWVLADGLELNLKAPEDVVVQGDYDLLKQMALNIVDNAIKFTMKGGHIEMALTQEGDQAILVVSDTGRGIPEEYLPHVTEPFYKTEASRSPASGAGLGLAIVNQVVQLHRGRIEIQSQVGIGTSVKVWLPTSPSAVLVH